MRSICRVCVVVLGDLGRSPRMLYQALSLSQAGAAVDVIGYAENKVHPLIAGQPNIKWHCLTESWRIPSRIGRAGFVLGGALKVAWTSFQLLRKLVAVPKPNVILVQNPPSIPVLFTAALAAFVRRSRLVIDWHNFGFEMVGMRIGRHHRITRLARFYERWMARAADAHLCVSETMRCSLYTQWNVHAHVLYDYAPSLLFGPEIGAGCIPDELSRLLHIDCCDDAERIVFVSPSSWTADEDYGMLLQALQQWDSVLDSEASRSHRKIVPLVLLTGRGPLRQQFEATIEALELRHIVVRTAWMAAEHYSRLLSLADAGICMHSSASGVDLPMKMADMFACGLPVVAFDYGPVLRERLQPGVTGLCFRTATELAKCLDDLASAHPTSMLQSLRQNVARLERRRWEEEWAAVAQPQLLS